jgi:hypothetical protein
VSWVISSFCVGIAYLLTSNGLLSFAPLWQIGVVVGLVAALLSEVAWQAGVIGFLVCAIGPIAAPPALSGVASTQMPSLPGEASLTFGGWILLMILCASTATAIGWLRHVFHPAEAHLLNAVLSWFLVAWIIFNVWAPLNIGPTKSAGYGTLKAEAIRGVPRAGHYVNDDAIYRAVFYHMHDGEPYYTAYVKAWLGLKHKPPLPAAVVAYRLPTMYWIWRLLPRDAFLIEIVFLFCASIGILAAAWITAQLASVRYAPLAAAALGAYAMATAMTVYVTYVDLPAACIALAGIALYVRAEVTGKTRYLWAAASTLLFAALIREILVYLIFLAIVSNLFGRAHHRLHRAAPWFAALGVFALAYLAHDLAVENVLQATSNTLNYMQGSPSFALDALRRFSNVMQDGGALLPVLFLVSLVGALGAWRRTGPVFVAFTLSALTIPIVGMMRFGNPGIDITGQEVNYWGNLFVPLCLAMWPVWIAVFPEKYRCHLM